VLEVALGGKRVDLGTLGSLPGAGRHSGDPSPRASAHLIGSFQGIPAFRPRRLLSGPFSYGTDHNAGVFTVLAPNTSIENRTSHSSTPEARSPTPHAR
jgi:hypothetical protein